MQFKRDRIGWEIIRDGLEFEEPGDKMEGGIQALPPFKALTR